MAESGLHPLFRSSIPLTVEHSSLLQKTSLHKEKKAKNNTRLCYSWTVWQTTITQFKRKPHVDKISLRSSLQMEENELKCSKAEPEKIKTHPDMMPLDDDVNLRCAFPLTNCRLSPGGNCECTVRNICLHARERGEKHTE